MPWGLVAAGVGTAAGLISAKRASDKQAQASDAALGFMRQQYRNARKDSAPYRDIGKSSIERLADILGIARSAPKLTGNSASAILAYERDLDAFNSRKTGIDAWAPDPGYQFRLDNTNRAIDRYQSAGRVTGGRAIKEAMRYGQDFASNEFNNSINRLFNLSGMGQAAVNGGNALGANTAANMGNVAMQAGQNQADKYANINNAIQSGLNNAVTYKTYNDWQQRLNGIK